MDKTFEDRTRRWTRRDCIALFAGMLAVDAKARERRRLLIVGDSLSAEYGLARGQGWVARLDARLSKDASLDVSLVNASISGDTTSGGLTRLDALLKTYRPTHVVIELGANDALRGFPLEHTRANLVSMAARCKDAGAAVLFIGMQMPPNYGRRYTQAFADLYADVARQTGAALVPFMLQGVADAPDARNLFQPDGIHPIAAAHETILATIWRELDPWLRRGSGRSAARAA